MLSPLSRATERPIGPPAAPRAGVSSAPLARAAAGAPRLPALGASRLLLGLAAVPLVFFLVVPLLVLLGRTAAVGGVATYLSSPVVVAALRLSVLTTLATVLLTLLLGTPTAYLLARYRFPGRAALDTLLDLPMVLPPAVAGIALLMTLGRRGAFGTTLSALGIEVGFTTVAVVLAQLFIAAPFYVKAARSGFETVDAALEDAAAVFGASPWQTFRRVTVPLALPALLAGAVMCWARALGEFGATIMFAGNLAGITQTMPLAIYAAMERDLNAALVLAAILVVVSFAVLLSVKALAGTSLGRLPR
ncbi:MAG TPA: ABC transporter permease [Chloroflexota bacterium]|jgi:molybdate transport system permease protein